MEAKILKIGVLRRKAEIGARGNELSFVQVFNDRKGESENQMHVRQLKSFWAFLSKFNPAGKFGLFVSNSYERIKQ